MQRVGQLWEEYAVSKTVHMCWRFLREKNLFCSLQRVQESSGVYVEHPFLQQLFESLVVRGDFAEAEAKLREFGTQSSAFCCSLEEKPYECEWERIQPKGRQANQPQEE